MSDYTFSDSKNLFVDENDKCNFTYIINTDVLPDNSFKSLSNSLIKDNLDDSKFISDNVIKPTIWKYGNDNPILCSINEPHCNSLEFDKVNAGHFRRKIVLKIIKKLIDKYNTELNDKKLQIKNNNKHLNEYLEGKKCNSYNLETNEEINPNFSNEKNIFLDDPIVSQYDKESIFTDKASYFCSEINNLNNNELIQSKYRDPICISYYINCGKNNYNTNNQTYIATDIQDESITDETIIKIYNDKKFQNDLASAIEVDNNLKKCKKIIPFIKNSINLQQIIFYKKNNENWKIYFFNSDSKSVRNQKKYEYLQSLLDLSIKEIISYFIDNSKSNIIEINDYKFLPINDFSKLTQEEINTEFTTSNFKWWRLFFKSDNQVLKFKKFFSFYLNNDVKDLQTDSSLLNTELFPEGFEKQREELQIFLKDLSIVMEEINYEIINKIINSINFKKEKNDIRDYFNEENGYINIKRKINDIINDIKNNNNPEITLKQLNEDEETKITTESLKTKVKILERGTLIDNTEIYVNDLISKD